MRILLDLNDYFSKKTGGDSQMAIASIREQLEQYVCFLYQCLLNRTPVKNDLDTVVNLLQSEDLPKQMLIPQLILSNEFLEGALDNAMNWHLYFIHNARLKMIRALLPEAKEIIDLGGANGSITAMGYSHLFSRITIIDLPPEERHEMYRDIVLQPSEDNRGEIRIHFGTMCDLTIFDNQSVDLVWSGQSIEHITEADAHLLCKEVMRVLKPGGYFCLDTPNRLLTEIHTADIHGGWIHPEHKIEYYPEHLRGILREHGFDILEERGICHMPSSVKNKKFDYQDFVLGSAIVTQVEESYIQFYKCQKNN